MPGVDTSSFVSASYNGATFMVEQYLWEETPVSLAGYGWVATKVHVEIDGFIDDTDPAAFYTKLAALGNLSVAGGSLVINGIGGVPEKYLQAGICTNGGPFCGFKQLPEASGPLNRKVKFTLDATCFLSNSTFTPARLRSSVAPNGLRSILQTGEFYVPNAADYFYAAILSQFQQQYASPNWIVTYELDVAQNAESKATYSMRAIQLATPLPAGGVASGTSSISNSINEQNQLTQTITHDLLLSGGDPVAIHTSFRPTSGNIVSAGMSVTGIDQIRLRSTYTVISGVGGNGSLISWSQTFGLMGDVDTFELKTYPGAAPIAVKRPQTVAMLRLSGSAIGLGTYPDFPSVPSGYLLAAPPEITYDDVDIHRLRIGWNYQLMSDPAKTSSTTIDAATFMPARPNNGGGH